MSRLTKITAALALLLPLSVAAVLPHKDVSVLSAGRWFKLAIASRGVARITWDDLHSMGIDPAGMDVSRIRLFSNGPGMLPEINSGPRPDDLREIAVEVHDGGDGHVDQGDYILFYGEGSDKWFYEGFNRYFTHQRNLYSDSTYYFLNFDQSPGRRVQPMPVPAGDANHVSSRFDDYQLHELDQLNLVRSGKEWYGEYFDNAKSTWQIPFLFPHIDSLSTARLRTIVVANASVSSYFYISVDGVQVDSMKVDPTSPAEYTQAGFSKFKQTTITGPHSDLTVTLGYNMPEASSKGWLNYMEMNVSRNLVWTPAQMRFRDFNSYGVGQVTEFTMKGATGPLRIWDVTNPVITRDVPCTLTGTELKFKVSTDTLREFIAFDGSAYVPVKCLGEIPNQNLHADQPVTLVMVTNPLFKAQAERLAAFHRQTNGLTVRVVTTEQVFNEFACGRPEPTAIRDYIKMLYDRANPGEGVRYVLLFGDGSYDPKNRVPGNNNMVPTFQSLESLNTTKTFVTDDFFGIMAEDAGVDANGNIDLGIGRLPVSDTTEARVMVDKIIRYSLGPFPVRADWRNVITFVADDENSNLHLNQAEELTAIVANKYPLFNVNKIYFDAYKLVEIPSGSRFPDVNPTINKAVNDGSLIVNYTGHGGEAGWSYEQALTVPDIESWSNYDKLPVFVTATCEFSRFDNPERFTAGEMVILHPNGGAIALYSTTRLAFAGLNIMLDTSFFHHLMDKTPEGEYLKMGDLIRLSKNNNGNNFQLRNFVLLGDPAQEIGFAGNNVRTLSINGATGSQPDTVRGLSTVTVKGQIEDAGGQKVTSFDGTVSCKVFDKPTSNMTLGNRPGHDGSYPQAFNIQNSLLFHGDAEVKSGEFEISFLVPKGIALAYGKGKLSYYAYNDTVDAAGYSNEIILGGRDGSVDPANQGPSIGLWLNDRNFVSGGRTGSSPVLLADLYDTNGINWYGLGIGHEIEAVLDNDRPHAVLLNDYFTPVFTDYTRGSISYPLEGIAAGWHTLRLKAWDLFDNSSQKEISFYVPENPELTVQGVMNYPNPMSDHTTFSFQPYQIDFAGVDVTIRIYDLYGKQVASIQKGFEGYSYETGVLTLSWNGTDDQGKNLPEGLYPYKIIFNGRNGGYSQTTQKLMIIR